MRHDMTSEREETWTLKRRVLYIEIVYKPTRIHTFTKKWKRKQNRKSFVPYYCCCNIVTDTAASTTTDISRHKQTPWTPLKAAMYTKRAQRSFLRLHLYFSLEYPLTRFNLPISKSMYVHLPCLSTIYHSIKHF